MTSIPKQVLRGLAAIGVAGAVLAALMASLSYGRAQAAMSDGAIRADGLPIRQITTTSDLDLFEPRPRTEVSGTVYFSNSARGGTITTTFEITGTPSFTLATGTAFDRSPFTVTSQEAPWFPDITYAVTVSDGTEANVPYTVTDSRGVFTSVIISYVQDITPPVTSQVSPTIRQAVSPVEITWRAEDQESGVERVELYYRHTDVISWTVLTMTHGVTRASAVSGTFWLTPPTIWVTESITYELASVAVDQLRNAEPQPDRPEAYVVVPPFRTYIPLVRRDPRQPENGDFEAGLKGWTDVSNGDMLVTAVSRVYKDLDSSTTTTGDYAQLGGDDSQYREGAVPVGYGALSQTISVPDVVSPTITILYRVATHDVVYGESTDNYFDDFEVSIDTPPWNLSFTNRHNAKCDQEEPYDDEFDIDLTNIEEIEMETKGLAFCDGNRTGQPSGMVDIYDTGWKTATVRLGSWARGKNVDLYLANFNRVDGYWNTWTYVDEVRVGW